MEFVIIEDYHGNQRAAVNGMAPGPLSKPEPVRVASPELIRFKSDSGMRRLCSGWTSINVIFTVAVNRPEGQPKDDKANSFNASSWFKQRLTASKSASIAPHPAAPNAPALPSVPASLLRSGSTMYFPPAPPAAGESSSDVVSQSDGLTVFL